MRCEWTHRMKWSLKMKELTINKLFSPKRGSLVSKLSITILHNPSWTNLSTTLWKAGCPFIRVIRWYSWRSSNRFSSILKLLWKMSNASSKTFFDCDSTYNILKLPYALLIAPMNNMFTVFFDINRCSNECFLPLYMFQYVKIWTLT